MNSSIGTKRGWDQWCLQREATLRDPYGWLSLIGLDWLEEKDKSLATFPGRWSAVNGTATFVPVAGEPAVYQEGALVDSPLTFSLVAGSSDRSLRDANGREIEVMLRFGRPCVRVRDPRADLLVGFQGVDRFAFDPTWVLRGRVRPYSQVKTLEVGSAVEGSSHQQQAWADADLALPDGEVLSVILTGSSPGSSSVPFFDLTSGESTPGWRNAPAVIDGETVVVDFNRSTIYPAHMTPFGTCPKPPESNVVPLRVEAGEKGLTERTPQ